METDLSRGFGLVPHSRLTLCALFVPLAVNNPVERETIHAPERDETPSGFLPPLSGAVSFRVEGFFVVQKPNGRVWNAESRNSDKI